jgi:hypothetical protein
MATSRTGVAQPVAFRAVEFAPRVLITTDLAQKSRIGEPDESRLRSFLDEFRETGIKEFPKLRIRHQGGDEPLRLREGGHPLTSEVLDQKVDRLGLLPSPDERLHDDGRHFGVRRVGGESLSPHGDRACEVARIVGVARHRAERNDRRGFSAMQAFHSAPISAATAAVLSGWVSERESRRSACV